MKVNGLDILVISWVSFAVLHEIEVIFKTFQQNTIAKGLRFHRVMLYD